MMTTRKERLCVSDDYGFPSDEELAKLADELFVMYDKEDRSTNAPDKP
jgi:hypothetical protein